jgi:uncharacterized protein YndB with AHSA1/START domain
MPNRLEVVAAGELDAVITRTFDAPRGLVWACHTKPELVRRWLLGPDGWSMPTCEIDLRVGGAFRYVWRNADGREMAVGGVFREVEALERLVHTELFDDDWTGGETVVTQTFAERDGKTTLRMTVRYSSARARDAALATPMAEGLAAGYARLDDILKTQAAA